jgi:hypothetical protein
MQNFPARADAAVYASWRGQFLAGAAGARLTQPVDDNARVTLGGTVHPLANARNDRGPASPDMQLERLQLVEAQPPTGGEPAATAA